MPLIGITNDGIEIAVSPTVVSFMNPIIVCGVIVLLFMCCKKIFESKSGKVNPTEDDHHLGEVPEWTKLEVFVTLFAVVTMITSITTVLITTSRIVTLDCVFALLIPPYAAFQAQKCTELKGIYVLIAFKRIIDLLSLMCANTLSYRSNMIMLCFRIQSDGGRDRSKAA